MVEFGKLLVEKRRATWAPYYIDYHRLKGIVKASHGDNGGLSSTKTSSSSIAELVALLDSNNNSAVLQPTSRSFQRALDQEIEKAVLFLLEQQGTLAEQLQKLCIEKQKLLSQFYIDGDIHGERIMFLDEELAGSFSPRRMHTIDLLDRYRVVAYEVLEFIRFIELNVTVVRKILKKHDKHCSSSSLKLSSHYLSSFYSDGGVDSHLHQLYHYEGVSALVATLQESFRELHILQDSFQNPDGKEKEEADPTGTLLSRAKRFLSSSSIASYEDESSALSTAHGEDILKKIAHARQRLQQSSSYVEVIAAQAIMFEADHGSTREVDSIEDEGTTRTRIQRISAFLNLASTFFYMTNYYIVAPTSGQYAHKLGSTDALASLIIGMTPNAALLATILYCWMSCFTYKWALVLAATSSLIGNILYALALPYQSLNMVLLGRFLNGFGSARSINRRYIADTFKQRDRTAASAEFVSAGALGMAAGPAIAAIVGNFPSNGTVWTPETAPGWIMAFFWAIYLVLVLFLFEEPQRLYELARPLQHERAAKEEGQALLASDQVTYNSDVAAVVAELVQEPKDPPLYRNKAVLMTLWIYFVLKLVLECLLSSTATITGYYFSWTASTIGAYLAFLGLLMFPANVVVARLSMRLEDRELIFTTLLAMAMAAFGFLAWSPSHYSVYQYSFFGVLLFMTANILEGPNMSLLSKVIPKSWAKGIFNSGFFATEAGTVARSVGDFLISGVASIGGTAILLNATFVPVLGVVLLTLVLCHIFYDSLVEPDDDEEDATS